LIHSPASDLTPQTEPSRNKPVRRIKGCPLLWKELQKPLMPNRTARTVVLIVASVVILMTYVFLGSMGEMDSPGVQAFYLLLYLVPAAFCTLLLSATTITSEKETRCWPLLLTTTLTDARLLRAKVAGVLRRSWPIWAPLGGHLLLSMVFLCISPVALLQMLLVAGGASVFIVGLGMYVSARLRRTTTAMVVTVSLLVAVWGGLPLVAAMGRSIVVDFEASTDSEGDNSSLSVSLDALAGSGPFVQAWVIADGASEHSLSLRELRYDWPTGTRTVGGTNSIIAGWAGVYLALGILLLWRTCVRFRRDIF